MDMAIEEAIAMKILVTGGAGFIGSHLVRLLLEQGHAVTVLDDLSTGAKAHIEGLSVGLWRADIREKAVTARIAAAHFDAVVHLAAQTMVDASLRDPHFDAEENVIGLVNVLEGARLGGTRRVIFASTAAVYGDVSARDLPVREEQALAPLSFYGMTKVAGEQYLALYKKIFGLDYVVLRFANVYGERQGDRGEGGVISIFAKRVARGAGITIFGDGGQTRDFVYAGDIASGIACALRTEHACRAYNLGTQTELSLNELVRVLGKAAGQALAPAYAAPREGDIYRSALSNAAARRNLGWTPKVTLEEGLRRTYAYVKETAAQ